MLFSLLQIQTAYAGGAVNEGNVTFILGIIGGLVALGIATYVLTIGKKEP